MAIRRVAVVAFGVLVLGLAGCGGESESAAPAGQETDTTAVTDDGSSGYGSTDETSTDESSTEETSTEETPTDVDLSALSGKCASLAGVGAKYAQALQAAGAGPNADLSKFSDAFEEFANEAPEEIRADLEVIAKNIGKYAEALKGLDLTSGETPTADQIAKLQEISKSFDESGMRKASDHIEAWVQENCAKS